MGLLSTLISEEEKNAKRKTDDPELQILRDSNQLARAPTGILPSEDSRDPGRSDQRISAGVREVYDANHPGLEGSAIPCPGCGSSLAWLDAYGGGPHCFRCRPYPTERLVSRLLVAQDGRWQDFATLVGQNGSEATECRCEHARTRKRVIKDFGFSEETRIEVFAECLTCGEWIPIGEA